MLYVLLAILTGVSVLILFKVFPKYGVDTFPAIIFNYITAAVTGIIFSGGDWSFSESACCDWFWWSVPLGALFICIFYLISQTAQRISISTASIANKMSVVLPVLFSFIFLHQKVTGMRLAGIILAIAALYLSSKKENNTSGRSLFYLPIFVFIGSGCIDIAINATHSWLFKKETDSANFTICTFLSAFAVGTLFTFLLAASRKQKLSEFFSYRNILAGVSLGIPNYFSIYFIFRSLHWGGMNSAQLFPVLNLSNVGLSAIFGYLLFREKLSNTNLLGIALAVAAIIIIAV